MRFAIHAATWVLKLVSHAFLLGLLGSLAGPVGTWIGFIVGLIIGGVHAWAITKTDCHPDKSVKAWFLLLIDNTWAVTNTMAGAFFLTFSLARGNELDLDRCSGRSSLVLRNGVMHGYATTIGTIEAGTTDGLDAHEQVHVLQARIFGPFFYPLVALSYVVVTIFPYWLLYHDHDARPIRNFREYFINGVYPHTWHEEWAYRY